MRYVILTPLLLLAVCWVGCKKNNYATYPLAAVNIVNASVNLGAVKVNFTDLKGLYASITTTVAYSANTLYPVNAETTVPMTIVPSADTTKTAFFGQFNFANAGVYSLYLAGQSTAVDTIFVKENIPSYPYTDSSYGVRFINLSYNSQPIKVTRSTTPSVVEFTDMAYKQASDFRTYPAKQSVATDTFQVRDAATNAILATYPIVKPRFFSCTLAWKGMKGATGTNAPGIMRINNY